MTRVSESTQQAAAWFSRLRADDVTASDRAAFDEWLRRDLEHRAAFESFEKLWSRAGSYAGQPEVAQIVRSAQGNRWTVRLFAMAAAATVAAIGILGFHQWQNHRSFGTRVGELQSVALSDGSHITLNTNSRLKIEFSAERRLVRLERGQAYFKLAQDLARPFEVVTRAGAVRALGTEFEVYQQDDRVLVTLLSGKVTVSGSGGDGAVMKPGQQVAMADGALTAPSPVSIRRSTSWLAGKLVFDDDTLEFAVAEANRYLKHQISIGDASLRTLRISGVYRTGEAREFVEALSSYFPVRAMPDEHGGFRLVARDEAAKAAS